MQNALKSLPSWFLSSCKKKNHIYNLYKAMNEITLFPLIMVHALKYETTQFWRWQSCFVFKCMHQIIRGQVHAPLSETTTKRKIWRKPVWQKHAFANVILILCLWYLLGLPSDSLVYEKPWIKNATFQLRAGAPTKKLIGVALVG